ncbi:MAG: HlyC/CorC family transporter [Candidatus Competibacteraceae bacterium]|nr:HlyC/CorC family transporter [Candidatus Competibacteraceae bacterium]
MGDIDIGALYVILVLLVVCSAFFSGSETGLMALNRYRLRHRAKSGHKAAQRASKLLERPDRLLGIILLGNNFVNMLACALATVIAIHFLGSIGIMASTAAMTMIVLIFGEVAPKKLAALYPERIAFPASAVLSPLLRIFYPLVWLTNGLANGLLRLFRIKVQTPSNALGTEELLTVLLEAGVMIPKRHQAMLLSILELEEMTVNDIMVPRNQLQGIDLENAWAMIVTQLNHSPYTRLVVYRGALDQVVGILHLRRVLNLMTEKPDFDRRDLESLCREPYFIPEGTVLTQQLVNFQQLRRRVGLVVDEYGDVLGLVTLDDILEEIVGEFTTDPAARDQGALMPRSDGSYIVDGGATIRGLNRALHWTLPADGPHTFNGLVMEHLEAIPEPGVRLTLAGHPTEIIETAGNRVKTAIIWPNPESDSSGKDD